MNPDELREHHRRRVKQYYYQTIHSLSQSREIVRQLTDQHRQLVEQLQASEHCDGNALRRYTEVTALGNQLRQEKRRFMELLEEHEKRQDRLMTLSREVNRNHVSVDTMQHNVLFLIDSAHVIADEPSQLSHPIDLVPPSHVDRLRTHHMRQVRRYPTLAGQRLVHFHEHQRARMER